MSPILAVVVFIVLVWAIVTPFYMRAANLEEKRKGLSLKKHLYRDHSRTRPGSINIKRVNEEYEKVSEELEQALLPQRIGILLIIAVVVTAICVSAFSQN